MVFLRQWCNGLSHGPLQVSQSAHTQCCYSILLTEESAGCCWMSFTSQPPQTLCSSTCHCRPALKPTPPASDSGSLITVVRRDIIKHISSYIIKIIFSVLSIYTFSFCLSFFCFHTIILDLSLLIVISV